MPRPPDSGDGAPAGTAPADAAPREGAAARGPDAGDALGPTLSSELVALNTMLTEALDLLVRERQSSAFKPPTGLPQPSGMATPQQFEAFRDLRTRLMLMAAGVGLKHFTTMVVGLSEGAGASFVARTLAAAFTLQQRIALIIDCNFRNATQHDALGPGEEVDGLFDFLGQGPDASVERLIRPTAIPGLHVIPAGSCETTLAGPTREHFSSTPMRRLMARLKDEPCFVILDGPPVLGSPDARILSDLADFVVLVVGYGRSPASEVANAAALFDRNKFAGVVFNEFDGASARRRARAERR